MKIALIIFTLAASIVRGQNSSEQIYNKFTDSVISIGNEEGYGSGIIISEKGHVLTNFHIVCSALPIKVTVACTVDGKRVNKEFEAVLETVHKKYDLAVLKLENPPKGLRAVKLKDAGKAQNGSRCFMIGSLRKSDEHKKSISKGLVSSSNFSRQNKKYIQISAELENGNSGGPLINSKGEIMGIVTYKAYGVDGIAFAIPVSAVVLPEFVKLSEKKANKDAGVYYENKGQEYLNNSARISNTDIRQIYLSISLYFYKMSMFELPNNASPLNNIALLYYKLKKYEISHAYCKKALSLKKFPETYHSLGDILLNSGKEDEAVKAWLSGSFMKGTSGRCSDHTGLYFLKKKNYVKAYYLIKKSLIQEGTYRSRIKLKTLTEISTFLSAKTIAVINSKKLPSEFSEVEMNVLAKEDNKLRSLEKIQKEKAEKEDKDSLDLFNELNE